MMIAGAVTMTLRTIMERAAAGSYGPESALIGKIAGLLVSAKFDHGLGPFICGTLGIEGDDGLHDGYLICPSYGADAGATQAYMRTNGEHENRK